MEAPMTIMNSIDLIATAEYRRVISKVVKIYSRANLDVVHCHATCWSPTLGLLVAKTLFLKTVLNFVE